MRVGELITFRIRITNTGSSVITGLPLADSFNMDFLTYLNASIAPNSGPGAGPTGQLIWNDLTGALGELLPGAGVEVLVNFQAKADTTAEAGTVTVNTATVSGITADPDGAAGPAPRFPDPLPPQSAQAPVGIVNPTATLLSGGQALLTAAGVEVSWQTVSEVNVAGFNLLRVGMVGGSCPDQRHDHPGPAVGPGRGGRLSLGGHCRIGPPLRVGDHPPGWLHGAGGSGSGTRAGLSAPDRSVGEGRIVYKKRGADVSPTHPPLVFGTLFACPHSRLLRTRSILEKPPGFMI